jgi:serine/threonine protein kinase/formylglycine-generating enzyme required for sulfatase activity
MGQGHDEPQEGRTVGLFSSPDAGAEATERHAAGSALDSDAGSSLDSSMGGLTPPSDAGPYSHFATASHVGSGPEDYSASVAGIIRRDGPVGPGLIEPGQVLFDRYQVERKIDEAGMGQVWLVRHLALDARRALKVIRPQVALNETVRARFIREARVTADLVHEHIVVVHDAQFSGDLAFIEMEFIRGQSLNKVMKPGEPRSLDWIGRILDQLCAALTTAHEHQVVHRDLKPSNLMLLEGRPPGREFLKVLDFGIAKVLGSDNRDTGGQTMTKGFVGTGQYASPEQSLDHPIDARSDIYSTGVLLYEMLTGFRPFSGTFMELVHAHAFLPPPPMADKNPQAQVPPEVEQVVMRCLAKNPAERPLSPRELAEAFLKALERSGVSPSRLQPGALVYLVDPHAPTQPMAESPSEAETDQTTPVVGLRPESDPRAVASTDRHSQAALLTDERPKPGLKRPRPAWLPVVAALTLLVVLAGAWIVHRVRTGSGRVGTTQTRPAILGRTFAPPRRENWARYNPAAREELSRWEIEGYEPDGQEVSADGWPKAVLRKDQARFLWHRGAIYLLEGYEPEGDAAADDGWPAAIVRGRDGVRFLRIPGGQFAMGMVKDAQGQPIDSDTPERPVILSGFYMQQYEVTNGEVEGFYKALNIAPAKQPQEWRRTFEELAGHIKEEARRHPAVMLSHHDAEVFAHWAQGRLPTEAQWEFAARSRGKGGLYVAGIDPSKALIPQANINNAGNNPFLLTMPVGSFPADRTEQGLFDLTGNVREWCRDVWEEFGAVKEPLRDWDGPPRGAAPDITFVIRGGSFKTFEDRARTTQREDHEPEDQAGIDLGFRLVIECPSTSRPTTPAAPAAR